MEIIFWVVLIAFVAWAVGCASVENHYRRKLTKGISPELISPGGRVRFTAEIEINYTNGNIQRIELLAGTTKKLN
jgi:hypothetical protein